MNFKNALIYTENFKFEKGCFSVEDGKFTNVMGEEKADAIDLQGAKVIPGLIDVHTHGNSGSDMSDGDFEGLVKQARYEAANGITSFAPTSLTLPYEKLQKAFENVFSVKKANPEKCAAIRGINMEGPFFSEAKKGAQNPLYLKNPDFEAFTRLNESCEGLLKIIDVAPELPGAIEFIEKVSKIATVSIAHTDTDYDHAVAGIQAGATHLTHLFNGMNSIHHRNPGPIPAGVEDERVSAELIGDGMHVHPACVRLAFKMFGPERMVLISDSLSCCGLPDGDYELGGQDIILAGGVAKLKNGTIAGSCTNVYECMRRVVSFGVNECDALRAATYNPARQLGCLSEVGSIANGKVADFVICDQDLTRRQVYLRGEAI